MESTQPGEAVKGSKQTMSEELLFPRSPEINVLFVDPLLHPRVGNQYQAQIPPELTKSELLLYLDNPAEAHIIPDIHLSFIDGQPNCITSMQSKEKLIKGEAVEFYLHDTNSSLKFESSMKWRESSLKEAPDSKVDGINQFCSPFFPAPCFSTEPWSDFELDCFLLGLYIFGKNLLQVAKFVGSKAVGQVLFFYYGRFYRSSRYNKWSACRKVKGRKSILGNRFFSGGRQQELLSRLLPGLSEECKHTLQQEFKAFADGRRMLDEYVSNLKSLVGLCGLVDAVGIGNKEDLTNLALESSRSSHTPKNHLKISSDKAFSSLSCAQILELLSGNNRLTKTISNELFWAAVWPRLLARGWHSELPKLGACAGSKNYLVFLIPGVKKFSRRRLRKREHYFDIVTDVLKKVASEPELLALEGEENEISRSKKTNGLVPEEKADDDCHPHDHTPHCYLQCHVSTAAENLMFTVVDTSLLLQDKLYVRLQLKSLPSQTKQSSKPKSLSKESVVCSAGYSGESVKDSESADVSLSSPGKTGCSTHSKGISNDGSSKHGRSDPHRKPAAVSVDGRSRTKKHHLGWQKTSDDPISLGINTKRRKLTDTTEVSLGSVSIKSEPISAMSLPVVDAKSAAEARIQEKYQKGSSSSLTANTKVSEGTDEETQTRHLFDLNCSPEIESELRIDYRQTEEPEGNLPDRNAAEADTPLLLRECKVLESPDEAVVLEQVAIKDDERQGKRNRAMSTRALESLESSFLNRKPRRKRSVLVRLESESRKFLRGSSKKSSVSANGSDADVMEESEESLSNPSLNDPLMRTKGGADDELLGLSKDSSLQNSLDELESRH